MVAFEWATLFALRVALRNGSVFIDHSFSFRSQSHMLISAEQWKAKRNNHYGHLGLPQDPNEFLEWIGFDTDGHSPDITILLPIVSQDP